MSTTARFDHPLYPRYRAERDAQPHGREADHEVAFPGFDEWLTYEMEAGYAEDVARVTVPAGAIAAGSPGRSPKSPPTWPPPSRPPCPTCSPGSSGPTPAGCRPATPRP